MPLQEVEVCTVRAPTALGTCSSEREGLTGSDMGSWGGGPLHLWSVSGLYLSLQSVDMATKNLLLVDFFLIPFFKESLNFLLGKIVFCASVLKIFVASAERGAAHAQGPRAP